MIRGRQGRSGIKGMSLAMLLDIIWAEIWDDCSAMADTHQYHEIVTALYLEGKDPSEIVVKDANGRPKRLSETAPRGREPSQSARDEMEAMRKRARELAEAKRLASPPDAG